MAFRDLFRGKAARRDAARTATHERLGRFWAAIGDVEPDVVSHLINPAFMGGPRWPGLRQAYRVIRRNGSTIIATDGLADPFDELEADGNGFGMELFLETADLPPALRGAPGDMGRIAETWAMALLVHLARQVAQAGGVTDKLDRMGVLSSESGGVSNSPALSGQVPSRFITEDDSVGVLIGRPQPDFPDRIDDMPLSPVRITPIVLLTADELEAVRSGGAAKRTEIADKLAASPTGHRCAFGRPSMA